MKTRLLALTAALCLAVSLFGCTPASHEEGDPSALPSAFQPVDPSAAPSFGDADQPSAPAESRDPALSEAPVESGEPAASQAPVQESVPPVEASQAPAEEVTAAGLRDSFMLTSSSSDAPTADFSDMSGHLENYYNLDPADLADFVFYMPDMSTALQEFFLAKAKPGKVDAVKAACQSRLDGLKEEAEFYAGTADFVDTAKVETVGDWVILAVCPEADRVAKIVRDFTK